ncbi:DUF2845 domain-containing protein [Pseudomonas typographi]|uniref:DUF2845 domain-containing protein n=1 Tax=Pseudomonas typographi TaxID=2715964 RepID=UPI0016855F00|nr:DUF2845 domain-containing protein [Pseudomonas typographi]MBD1553986.1 DUF2845 domain-containing protein [Pseudomonas typographi]
MDLYLKLLAIITLMVATSAQAADSMRCNGALVSVNDPTSEVLRKCGEPAGRGPVSYIKTVDKAERQVTVPSEQWTYGPYYGMYHYLRFEGDRLVSISSERG